MKRLTAIFLLTTVMTYVGSACSDEEEKGRYEGMGCMTAIPKSGGTTRVQLRCCTYQEFLAGDNVAGGGVPYFANYKEHKWDQVDDCSECQ